MSPSPSFPCTLLPSPSFPYLHSPPLPFLHSPPFPFPTHSSPSFPFPPLPFLSLPTSPFPFLSLHSPFPYALSPPLVAGLVVSSAPYSAVYSGVWGYNGFLAGGAIAFFMIPTGRNLLLAAVNAVFVTFIMAALLPVFSANHLPVFTFPFCLGSVLMLAATIKAAPENLVASPSTPELHLLHHHQNHNHSNSNNINESEGGTTTTPPRQPERRETSRPLRHPNQEE
ncbi:hypothetical protein Pcinc_042266 [Petrolisthes cinctipes]|uniref:Urea transporter n=1 Tax=Petrolisthes cinctipes TaxID=88211 RepID=A0AAE1BJ39_PETCI|nr:hypothetical protein Pcinc_042266 [Petrolisthes cinctipes]